MVIASELETGTWVEKARNLAPLINTWRDTAEEERRLPTPVFNALMDEGFFRLALPKAFGGQQVRIETAVRTIEEIGRHDGSVAWNLMICGLGGLFADYLPEGVARSIFGLRDIAVGSFAPTGQAVPEAGGYRVRGRWSFISGCQNATWLVGGFLVTEDGQPRRTSQGGPDTQLLFMRASDCEIIDTWKTAGMRGTGSHDIQASDVFVPAERGFPFGNFFAGPAPRPSRAYHQPFFQLIAPAMAAISLGIARDAIDSFMETAKSKTAAASTSSLAQQHTTHLSVGRAEALYRAARAYLYETVREVDGEAKPSPEESESLSASVRLASASIAQMATQAVDIMFEAGGGSAIYASNRLEHCFRDVHMVTHHIQVSPSNVEMVGQYLLGLGLQVRR